jgi:hypothetical protein
MEKKKVIHRKYLPTRIPLITIAVAWLLCDRIGMPQWAWGVFWTIMVVLIILSIFVSFYEDDRDVALLDKPKQSD